MRRWLRSQKSRKFPWTTPFVAGTVAEQEAFKDLDVRSRLIEKLVGSKSGQWLKETIYVIVPELTGMDWGEEIET